VIDLFGVSWDELRCDDVAAFLADAGEEGITWEAKGDDDRGTLRPDSIRKAACGLANTLGGYVIVGAKWNKKARRWDLPGITAPDAEPELWIGKALRGLRPEPRHAAKTWPSGDRRVVAVVWVEPVAQAPCMTAQGRIYERVSGATVPVEDPTVLARLFDRGSAARERAAQFADRAATNAIYVSEWIGGERSVGVAVAIAPISRETDDITSRLFVPTFRVAMSNAIWQFFGHRHPTDMTTGAAQDALIVAGHFENDDKTVRQSYLLRAAWDGTVAAAAMFSPGAVALLTGVDSVLVPGWRTIVPLAERLGGYGSAQLTFTTIVTKRQPSLGLFNPDAPEPPPHSVYARLPERTDVRRVVPLREPLPEDIGSIQREMQRAAGIESLEPEPPSA
jgi:hypothetical protein